MEPRLRARLFFVRFQEVFSKTQGLRRTRHGAWKKRKGAKYNNSRNKRDRLKAQRKREMKKLDCDACGGTLKKEGRFLLCEYCGAKYILSRSGEKKKASGRPDEEKDVSRIQSMKRRLILSGAALALIATIAAVLIFLNTRKYDPGLTIRLINVSDEKDWENERINLRIKSEARIDARQISGRMIFYDVSGNEIAKMILNIPDVPCDQEKNYNLNINQTTAEELDGTRFSELRITVTVNEITFVNGKKKDYGRGTETVVKEYGE